MGGRLDSTNIIFPEVSVITNIGLDHMKFLGNSLEKIAREKAGIIKKCVPVVIGQSQSSTRAVFLEKAKEMDSEISFADELIDNTVPCSLSGVYQKSNIKTVLQTIEVIKNRGYTISEKNIKNALFDAFSSAFFFEVSLPFEITLLSIESFTEKCFMESLPVSSKVS